jgi:hypothetical protein
MIRHLTCSSPGKVEGDDGCIRLMPKEVSEQRYMSFYKVRYILFVDSQRRLPEIDTGAASQTILAELREEEDEHGIPQAFPY